MFTNLHDYLVLVILFLSAIGILATLIGFKLLTKCRSLDFITFLMAFTDGDQGI